MNSDRAQRFAATSRTEVLRGLLMVISLACGISVSHAQSLPQNIGQCVRTSIVQIADRFGAKLTPTVSSEFDPGTSVTFANGGFQVSYERIPQIYRSRVGDSALVCLVSIPRNCPPGDDRGRVYTATNLRTEESWTLPDSQHSCGGA
jgi:hypothetical protein